MGAPVQLDSDIGQKNQTTIYKLKMKFVYAFMVNLAAFATAQDTYHCPDGWEKHEGTNFCECFLFASNEARVSHRDAGLVCASHDAFLAEVANGPRKNDWLVNELIKRHTQQRLESGVKNEERLAGPHWEDQWWIGATSRERHDESNPGEWIWEHSNTPVEWFDWAPGEPNDADRERCMTFVRYDYGVNEDIMSYNWNDQSCGGHVGYICEKSCAM